MCKTSTSSAGGLSDASGGFLPAVSKQPPSFQKPVNFSPIPNSNSRQRRVAWKDFVDPSKPWVLVPNGSYDGVYDFVPKSFRVGPWHIACCVYLAALVFAVLMLSVDCFYAQPPAPQPFLYYPAYSFQWWYNATAFLWTMRVSYTVWISDLGWRAWGGFTLQSWTLIVLRHGLSALVPFVPAVVAVNERLRFPMLAQATITFGIWNFILVPAILMHIKTTHAKQDFMKLVASFLLTQLHVFNLVFSGISGVWGTPVRELDKVDLCVAMLFALQYVLFYLCILDRLGVHYYFIFSPRTPMALLWWSVFVGLFFVGFTLWKGIVVQYGTQL